MKIKNLQGIICLVLFFLFANQAWAAEKLSINGYEWQTWSGLEKIGFVQGWVVCGKEAADNLMIWSGKDSEDFYKSQEDAKRQFDVFKDEGILIGGVTIRQIIDTIDKIYSDARVKTMDIAEVMPLVNGRLIQGWTENELDQVIAINVKLKQCEETEKEQISEEMKQGKAIKGCGSIRKARNLYLEKLKKQ